MFLISGSAGVLLLKSSNSISTLWKPQILELGTNDPNSLPPESVGSALEELVQRAPFDISKFNLISTS